MKKALLLSGGLDSVALAYWMRPELAITLDYGQSSAAAEFRAANKVCQELDITHLTLNIDCRALGSGDMANRRPLNLAPTTDWWPYRNQLLATLAAPLALEQGMQALVFGTVSTDGTHADGRAEFYQCLDRLFALQEGHMRILAPALELTSAQLIRDSGIDLSLLAWAHSCHTGNLACGNCRGCFKHQTVMGELGYGQY